MGNPFETWKPEDVERHNTKVLTARQHNLREGVGEYEYKEFQTGGAASGAKLKRVVAHEPVGAAAGKAGDAGRVRVRIISYRRRLLDPDNLAGGGKYFLDCVRRCGFVRDDCPAAITLESVQEKVGTAAAERTEIELEWP